VPQPYLPYHWLSRRTEASPRYHLVSAIILAGLALPAVLLTSGCTEGTLAQSHGEEPCSRVLAFAGSGSDAGPALRACLDATPADGIVTLPPGRYLVETPIRIARAVTLRTSNTVANAPPCFEDEKRCASLHLAIRPDVGAGAVMPLEIDSNNVHLDRLIIEGAKLSDPALTAQRCVSDKEKPMAGGLRINGNENSITRSIFRNFGCYTAVEYGNGIDVVIKKNLFTSNGIHNIQLHWADGLTIHSGNRFEVTGNHFRDNTDVQLIFGSCINCIVKSNRFSHSDKADGGSFAELMLHAWPNATSGDFTGTHVTDNDIDCGSRQRCGFGIMIGSAPWYDAPVFGGSVKYNRVRNAMLALNVDNLTGPMTIENNDFNSSNGTYPTMCGPVKISNVTTNISKSSRHFILPSKSTRSLSKHYCILNFDLK
jgi:hypothetical protein